ncbi:MAG: enoyl-CoA hydratase/isomerase family protein [Deltaproteobacteria bacterium]|nr:enoyl-CoA hydratase/isomerase family protein [Deltaproteobacteria bacterium]
MSESPTPAVVVERQGSVALLVLDRPENRNSMTPELLDAFAAAVASVRHMADVRCVVVTGRGSSFCAGADFKSGVQRTGDGRLGAERSYAMYTAFLSLLDLEVPVVGALQGHAVGGGFGLAMVCDLRIAHASARFGANFARLGLGSGMAISDLLPRLIGVPRAMEMLLTGRLISGEQGAAWGLFNRAVPADDVLPAALELANDIAQSAPIVVRLTKRAIYQNLGWDPRTAAWREAFGQAATVDTEDCKEGVTALLEKRPPRFQGR